MFGVETDPVKAIHKTPTAAIATTKNSRATREREREREREKQKHNASGSSSSSCRLKTTLDSDVLFAGHGSQQAVSMSPFFLRPGAVVMTLKFSGGSSADDTVNRGANTSTTTTTTTTVPVAIFTVPHWTLGRRKKIPILERGKRKKIL